MSTLCCCFSSKNFTFLDGASTEKVAVTHCRRFIWLASLNLKVPVKTFITSAGSHGWGQTGLEGYSRALPLSNENQPPQSRNKRPTSCIKYQRNLRRAYLPHNRHPNRSISRRSRFLIRRINY